MHIKNILAFTMFVLCLSVAVLYTSRTTEQVHAETITQSETVTAAAVTNPVFTYQGRLTEEGNPATGTYDFVFTLYDAPTDGTQVGNAILMEDVDVNDGFFTVPLDFGSDIFLRGTLFLEIRLRTGSATEEYTILAPRRAITSTPYAADASHASALSAPDGDPFNAVVIDDDGKMGIGTPDPDALMDISGKVSDTIGVNHLLQFNNTFGFRIDSTTGHNLFVDTYNSGWNLVPALTVNRVAGNVGIGTSNPTQRLAVTGNISATGEFIVNSQAVLGQGPSDTGGGFDRIWIGDGNSADGSSALALRAGGAV
ncbi:hypothetical protein KFU94_06150 [Chloroflexi bacterium TSY]|nr:hypothetical protein [Chloroflexi bacterium TSY]